MNLQPRSDDTEVSFALSQILTDMRKLVRQELQLANANLKEQAYLAQIKIALTGAGSWLLMVGAVLLGFALVRLLQTSGVEQWLSYAIVSAVYFGVGIPLVVRGKPFKPCAVSTAPKDEITSRRRQNESGS